MNQIINIRGRFEILEDAKMNQLVNCNEKEIKLGILLKIEIIKQALLFVVVEQEVRKF